VNAKKDEVSLEKIKCWVDVGQTVATLLVTVAIFWFTHKYSEAAAQASTQAQQFAALTAQRVALWNKISGDLNDMYSYLLYVGYWKQLTPTKLIEEKREVEKIAYGNKQFFSNDFFKVFQSFIKTAFEENNGWGTDAKLKTSVVHRTRDENDKDWADHFTGEDTSSEPNRTVVHNSYYAMLKVAAKEFSADIAIPGVPQLPVEKEATSGSATK